MEIVRPCCGQPSNRGRLQNRTGRRLTATSSETSARRSYGVGVVSWPRLVDGHAAAAAAAVRVVRRGRRPRRLAGTGRRHCGSRQNVSGNCSHSARRTLHQRYNDERISSPVTRAELSLWEREAPCQVPLGAGPI